VIEGLFDMYGQRFVDLIKSKVPVVTGKTRDSVNYEVTRTENAITLKVTGRAFFKSVETGRGPYKQGGYQEFDQRLDEWMSARGFPSKISKSGKKYYLIGDQWMTGKSLAYLINKRGDRKHRQGPEDVYSLDVDRLVEQLKSDLATYLKQEITDLIKVK
jgi:hypothetical protein